MRYIKINFKIIAIYIIIYCLISCKKEVGEERPEFFGTWFGHTSDTYYQIEIDENSNATYKEYSLLGGGTNTHYGKARANNKVFKVGRFRSFKIYEYPHEIDTSNSQIYVPDPDMFSMNKKKATWKMGLTNFGAFYRADY